jgi:hypothetical protein
MENDKADLQMLISEVPSVKFQHVKDLHLSGILQEFRKTDASDKSNDDQGFFIKLKAGFLDRLL